MNERMSSWTVMLKQLGDLLSHFKDDKLGGKWQKEDLLMLQQQFVALIEELLQFITGIRNHLDAREQLIDLWDENKSFAPLTKQLFGQEQYLFYKRLWDEFAALLPTDERQEDLYFRISITAVQLLFLLQIMHEAKVIEAPKKGNLFAFISKHVGTFNQETLSYESLRKKYHAVDRNTIVKVRRLLLDLLNLINTKHL